MADSKGAIYNPQGLDIDRVAAHKKVMDSVQGYSGADNLTTDELISIESDVLIPAALEGQIHAGNAGKIKTKIIAEGANNPLTIEANDILTRQGHLHRP